MSNQSRAAGARAEKHNGVKRARQLGAKAVRDAVDAMHAEEAQDAAEVAQNDQNDTPETGDDADG